MLNKMLRGQYASLSILRHASVSVIVASHHTATAHYPFNFPELVEVPNIYRMRRAHLWDSLAQSRRQMFILMV